MRQTKRRNAKMPAAPAAPKPADDDPVPENIDEFRTMLARRIAMFIGDRCRAWRGCPEPACRRARRCIAPQIQCTNYRSKRPSTPDQVARTKALVQRAIKKRLAQIEAERGAVE